MIEWNWDDLRMFLTLAREGSLTASARELDVSHPTVSRRVKALERAFGARLFDRLPDRFVLTPAGAELLADARSMEDAAAAIDRRRAGLGDVAAGTVRLSAGEAMVCFLARHLRGLRHDLPLIEFELVSSHLVANLSRREADLLIREDVPDLAGIESIHLGRAAFAVYGPADLGPDPHRTGPADQAVAAAAGDRPGTAASTDPGPQEGLDPGAGPWLGFDDDHLYMPGQAWTRGRLAGGRPPVRVTNWLVLVEAVRTGAGVAVLPCYLADHDPGLRRLDRLDEEATVDQWLLVHRDLRDVPRIRAAIEALVALFERHEENFAGR